jgi:16S rRNA (guanine966-N2)-methyltransferase
MRVISGSLGGREFEAPSSKRTHPMSERARGGLFNTLGDIQGLTILDAFAGSGALSFEAISRGAKSVIALDNDHGAQLAVTRNISTLELSNYVRLVKSSASAWLKSSSDLFDVVLLDPPYDNLQPDLLIQLAGKAKADGVVVISLPKSVNIELPSSLQSLKTKSYGDAVLHYFRRI